MDFDYSKLRGRIAEKFVNQSSFSKALGTAKQTVNGKLNGRIQFTKRDIVKWSEALNISVDEIGAFFYTPKV